MAIGKALYIVLHNSIYYFDRSVLLENTPLVKFTRNYIRDPSGVFSISSLVSILMTSFLALSRPFGANSRWKMRSFVKYCLYHSEIKFISSRRLDYQPLFGKWAHAHPRKDGWMREPGIVNFGQWETCLPESSRQHKLHKLAFKGINFKISAIAQLCAFSLHSFGASCREIDMWLASDVISGDQ